MVMSTKTLLPGRQHAQRSWPSANIQQERTARNEPLGEVIRSERDTVAVPDKQGHSARQSSRPRYRHDSALVGHGWLAYVRKPAAGACLVTAGLGHSTHER